jgi:polysaccharide biosynthesis protein PslG
MPRSGWTTRLPRACKAALPLAACLLALAAPSAAAVPGTFWGVIPQAEPSLEQLQRLKRGGVDSMRVGIGWGGVQPLREGPFDWSGPDRAIERATQAGIEVLPTLGGAPAWAVRVVAVPGSGGSVRAPRNLPAKGAAGAGWSAFAAAAVARYGPTGSFWAEHPGIPPRPIRTWQVWNEQNFLYFVARPNPSEYGKLVKLSFNAVRSVDPAGKIILGGMFARPAEAELRRKQPLAYFATDFLDRMYERTPGIRSKFHGVALHPYTGDYRRLTPYIEEFRTVLKANHDAGKGLWITELGWSSQPPSRGNSFAKGRRGQAQQLSGAFSLLRKNQRKWRLKRLYWFSVDDQPRTCNFCDGSGLFASGFTPKPAWFAYTRFAGGQP